MPLISVVTVVLNGVEFIRDTIESVLGQTCRNFEYIVVDGGSTDGTVDVIKSYGSRITKWVSERDDGIADAFNKGWSLAAGRYVLFLNSDDALAHPEVLGIMSGEIMEHGYPQLIYGDCDVLDRNTGKLQYRASITLTRAGLNRGQMIPQPSLFASRSYFERYGTFDNEFKVAMDYEWLLRGGFSEQIVHVPVLVTRVRSGGISTQDRGRNVREIVRALRKNGQISSGWGEFRLRGYFFARRAAKTLLESAGIYGAFAYWRNRNARPVNGAKGG